MSRPSRPRGAAPRAVAARRPTQRRPTQRRPTLHRPVLRGAVRARVAGFTLLEVLVALAIFALVASTAYSASSQSLRGAQRLETLTLAGWIADNRLTELQLASTPPAPGETRETLRYATRDWVLESRIEAAGDPALRHVTLRVGEAGRGPRATVRLDGFVEVR